MKILFAGDFSVQGRAVRLFQDTDKAVSTFQGIKDICGQHELSIVNFEESSNRLQERHSERWSLHPQSQELY